MSVLSARVRQVEIEMKRLERLISRGANPLDIFNIDASARQEIETAAVQRAFQNLARLIHPDKNGQHQRFIVAFQAIVRARDLLQKTETRQICVETLGDDLLMVQRLEAFESESKRKERQEEERETQTDSLFAVDLVLHQNLSVIIAGETRKESVKQLLQNAPEMLVPAMNARSAEHTKNIRASSKDKHENGIRQRKVQQRAAQRRIPARTQQFLIDLTANKTIALLFWF